MAGETVITVVGNLTADPELRYTQNGLAVANFTIASTPRTFDRAQHDAQRQFPDMVALRLVRQLVRTCSSPDPQRQRSLHGVPPGCQALQGRRPEPWPG